MRSPSSDPTLQLLLSNAADLRPLLENGLPQEAASLAPRPARTPPGVDRHLLDLSDADPNDLSLQRWGVIAPEGPGGDAALGAIAPLIALRESEQGARATVHRVPPGMDLEASLRWKNDVLYDRRIPASERCRYLLILGDLDEVSLELQHVLANGAFVGRLHVGADVGGPGADGLSSYSEKVVHWAREPAREVQPEALFFAAEDDTAATAVGRALLVEPCVEMARASGEKAFPAAKAELLAGIDSSDALARAVEVRRPSVLLSLCHGVGRPRGDWPSVQAQRTLQGAIVVSGKGSGRILTAPSLKTRPFLPGGLWLMVSCFGAGTPRQSAFHPWLSLLAREGAYSDDLDPVLACLPGEGERPFLAALPQAALANPRGPLAMIAHMDLTWSFAFMDPRNVRASRASLVFGSLQAMVRGSRAGVALDALMRSYREVNDELLAGFDAEENARLRGKPSPVEPWRRGNAFMLRNDLRGYVLLGDPAARLPLAGAAMSRVPPPPAGHAPPEVRGPSPASSLSAPVHDATEMEEAVLAMLRGEEPRNIAERHRVSPDVLEHWTAEYRAAGRERLAKLHDKPGGTGP